MVKKTVKKAKPVAGKGRQSKGKGKALGANKPEVEVVVTPEVPEIETPEVKPVNLDELKDKLEEIKEDLEEAKEPEPEKEEKPVKESKSKAGELWYNTEGEAFLKRGHGQRNIVIRAGRAAGLSPSEAVRRFAAFNGAFRERILSLFD